MNDPGIVATCFLYPGFCIDGGQPRDGEGVFDTQVELFDGYHVYISRRMGVAIGRAFGLADQDTVAEADGNLRAALAREARLRAEVGELETRLADLAAVERAIARAPRPPETRAQPAARKRRAA